MGKFKEIIPILLVLLVVGCKPDNLEIELYSSDIEETNSNKVVEIPLKATFNLLGEDEENLLPVVKKIVMKYLPPESEVQISNGTYGKIMTVITTIPIGKKTVLKKYMQKNPRVSIVEVENGLITLQSTSYLKKLDTELSKINMMMGAGLPSSNTSFRITSDSNKDFKVSAIAVFSENKPYLQYSKMVKKRKSVVIDFKGGDDSIYSGISPQFNLTF